MNLILENSEYVKWHTFLGPIFREIPEFLEYHWLITDLELNTVSDPRLDVVPVLIDGQSLNDIIQKNDVQFIWAVLSGFKEEIESIPQPLPYADGNKAFWSDCPKPQATDAELEIVCWDSTCTLFIGVNERIALKLTNLYPDILDLDVENKRRRSLP
jgi:hypothetical protein